MFRVVVVGSRISGRRRVGNIVMATGVGLFLGCWARSGGEKETWLLFLGNGMVLGFYSPEPEMNPSVPIA